MKIPEWSSNRKIAESYPHRLPDDSTEDWIVFFDFWPGRAGYLSGPPENCYPPEPPELDITAIRNTSGSTWVEPTDEIIETLENFLWKKYREYKAGPTP